MIRCLFSYQQGYAWHSRRGIHFKGNFLTPGHAFAEHEAGCDIFDGVIDFEYFTEVVRGLNGLFSVVVETPGEVFLAVDRQRMFPLFYRLVNGDVYISDDARRLATLGDVPNFDDLAVSQILASGHTSGKYCLYRGIFQVQAGEAICLGGDKVRRLFYYSYAVNDLMTGSYTELAAVTANTLDAAFSDMITTLKGRTAVIPLSGGYDSRLVAYYFKKHNYQNVVCFTYGRKGNPEAVISRKVADMLGFRWLMIEYTPELIGDYLHDPCFRDYMSYSSNGTSMFFMQEFFAVKYLKENNLIPPDSVFIPGHSGDFLGGSQLTKYHIEETDTVDELVYKTYRQKYFMKPPVPEHKDQIIRLISSFFEDCLQSVHDAYPWTVYEDRDYKEKLAKFICNSVNVYSFFGYEFRLPFYDLRLTSCFSSLPFAVKLNKKLYDDILINQFFKNYDLNFHFELSQQTGRAPFAKIKRLLRKFVPPLFEAWLLKRSDTICYYEITRPMVAEMRSAGLKPLIYGKTFNSLIIQWMIFDYSRALSSSRGTNLKLP